jgi:hypothetical protein
MDGHKLTVRLNEKLSVAEAGTLLLNLERQFHREVNPSIEVFLEVLTDANKLRVRYRNVETT